MFSSSMHSDVIERVEVAKLLLIKAFGLVGKFKGKRLKDIQLSGKLHLILDNRSL